MKSLLAAVLLAASTTLMAYPNARPSEESLAIRQTEKLVSSLDLSKRQTNKILAINKEYFRRNAQLAAQCRQLEKEGCMDAAAQKIIREALAIRQDARTQAIKSVLNDEQQLTFDNLVPERRDNKVNSMRMLRAMPRGWEEPRS